MLSNNATSILMNANHDEWLRFQQVHDLCDKPSVFLLQYDTDFARIEFQQALNEIVEKKVVSINGASLASDNLLAEIIKVQLEGKNIALIHIFNFEQAIKKHPQFLLKLNAERDTIFRTCQVHLVFWLNQFEVNMLQKEAFPISYILKTSIVLS
jgi:hypothetical protein